MNNVCIAIPTKDGNIYFELVLRLLAWANQKTIPVQIMIEPFQSPIDHCRNSIVKRFLSTNCTHLLMIDNDIVPPTDTLERLLFHNKEIIGAICPVIGPDKNNKLMKSYNAYHRDVMGKYLQHDWPDSSGLEEVDAIGTGCIMIKRKVFEDGKLLFTTEYDEEGIKWTGEDISFCENAKDISIQIYADYKLKCKHIKSCNLLEL